MNDASNCHQEEKIQEVVSIDKEKMDYVAANSHQEENILEVVSLDEEKIFFDQNITC